MKTMRIKRGYKRETPISLVRDYKLFAIACEGSKTEPNYFRVFRYLSRKIAVDIIEQIVDNAEALSINPDKSAPKWVLDRAVRYIEKEGLSDEDDLWFVMDIDRWSELQIREIAEYCSKNPNWHIVLSNPCFEVWLYFHKKTKIDLSDSASCQEYKNQLSVIEKGGYHPYKFIPNLNQAINNSKKSDSSPNYFMPNFNETKVYLLGEAIMKVISKKDFDEFLNITLQKLIKIDIEKAKLSKK